MARFGKKAELESQKSVVGVECLISVSEDGCQIDPVTGKPFKYYVEAQRLQDNVDEEDAKAGKADANPYIVNRKEFYKTASGEMRQTIVHTESISAYGMEKIKEAAVNEFDTVRTVFDEVTGERKETVIHNYIVKLNIGFDALKNSGFFYVPKTVNKTPQDEAYSFRNMPKAGRSLTQEIIDRHNEITRLSKEAFFGQSVEENSGKAK